VADRQHVRRDVPVFRDADADIRRARGQPRRWLPGEAGCEFVERGRARRRRQSIEGGAPGADPRVGRVRQRLGGVDERAVAGAAAEIAGERVENERAPRCRRFRRRALREGIETHDEPRRAKAALARVERHDRLLRRMRRVLPGEALRGQHHAAVKVGGAHDAGVHGAEREALALPFADDDRAGPAIALGATLLGGGQPCLQPQVVEHGEAGFGRDRVLRAVQDKACHGAPGGGYFSIHAFAMSIRRATQIS
jgi:hypothetical protein